MVKMPAVSITVPTLHSLLQESVNLEEEMEERFTPPADSKEEVVKREWGKKHNVWEGKTQLEEY